jgi:hypothetical protein
LVAYPPGGFKRRNKESQIMNWYPTPVVLLLCLLFVCLAKAQDTVTGAFQGTVTDSRTGAPIVGAEAKITNPKTGLVYIRHTDARGVFYQGQLQPGVYRIEVSMAGFETRVADQRLEIGAQGEVVPVPVTLEPSNIVAPPPPRPPLTVAETDIPSKLNRSGAVRSQSFSEEEVSKLPLGSLTLIRTFDQLAQLAAGVAPPPQTLGSVAGPGQGAGVGSAGQFSVNGLRSRANNFTVDGSDNNDEDIGVRRQGFVSLIPQSIESIESFQIITLLAPAQYGRNLGAQVNAVSKSGGKEVHGTLYGFFNSSRLNARNFFDTDEVDNDKSIIRSVDGRNVILVSGQTRTPIEVRNAAGGEDSFTLGKFGATLGGPIKREKTFYFLSSEGQIINATQEESFAVPTVEQRGAFGSGASGISKDPFTGKDLRAPAPPVTRNGAGIFSLFPFPNQPIGGVYGANTYKQVLPANSRGVMMSAKFDHHFKLGERRQTVTGRYNYTNDRREIPVTGGALFSSLRPRARAQNFSFFTNNGLSDPSSVSPLFNQMRFSYGRTRLIFQEVRDRDHLLPTCAGRQLTDQNRELCATPFLLNAPFLLNTTVSGGDITYTLPQIGPTVEQRLGPLGQVAIAGFSPVGVDVFNFPQQRVNNTYQLADNLSWQTGKHSLTFGADLRRTELNSDLPRNARPLVTFQGGPRLTATNGAYVSPTGSEKNPVIKPEDFAAVGAASGFYLTLLAQQVNDARISLRYNQLDFFAQDEWRLRRNLSLSAGVRYEYNTAPHETNGRIEQTFNEGTIQLLPDLRGLIGNRGGRIFEPDRNNVAPRISLAWSPNFFGRDRATVFRAGYGLFYDQILGTVVSQSRNVFPTFLTLNLSGFGFDLGPVPIEREFSFINPAVASGLPTKTGGAGPLVAPGSVNKLNPEISLDALLKNLQSFFPAMPGLTLPDQRLDTPLAHHYGFTVEQQLGPQLVVSVAYVGTQGRNLLRFDTPNLGLGLTLQPIRFVVSNGLPSLSGLVKDPDRSRKGLGAINLFKTDAGSRYDSLQIQARGRLAKSLQYQVAYTLARAIDDVSDVFDLAGAPALPQNSLKPLADERGPANFDVRHRAVFNFIYDFADLSHDRLWHWLTSGLQLMGAGQFQTGQPFTVNSIFDINQDGNLTDRLNTLDGIIVTGDRRQPLRLVTDNKFKLLAPFGQDGAIGRNLFRAGGVIELDVALVKSFAIAGRHQLSLRVEFFNLINHANFGIPVRWLEAPGFGEAMQTITPSRRIQISLKYVF